VSDPFKHVAAGQKLTIPAATWNHVLDSTRAFRSRRLGPSGGISHGLDGYAASDVVLIKNATGSTRPAGSVLRITGIINSPVDVPFETRRLPFSPAILRRARATPLPSRSFLLQPTRLALP
jgi:hypothetical protein